MTAKKILVADKDANALSLIETRLQARNYEVFPATYAEEVVRLAAKVHFDCMLIGSSMEEGSGIGLCKRVKQNSHHFGVPIILLAEEFELRQLVSSPERGFDDFLIKPFDAFSLQLRIELNLLRVQERLEANPLTKLPGAVAIENEVKRRIERHEIFSVCYIDVNHFKSFNDRYGFHRGDSVICHTARLIESCLEAQGAAHDSFIGHIGGDDFIVVMPTEQEVHFAQTFLQEFDRIITAYYDEVDRKRKSVLIRNRNGVPCSFPLMSVCIAAVTNKHRHYQSMAEISRDAVEVKGYLKTQPGSHYLRDRRAEPVASIEETVHILPRTSRKSKKEKPLGQLLLAIGLVSEEELNLAVRRHVETGERLGQVLLRMNMVTTSELGRCLEEQLGVPYVNVRDAVMPESVPELLDLEFLRAHEVVPVACQGHELVLAMVDPKDRQIIEMIEQSSGLKVTPKLALENELEAFLEKRHQGLA
ncbi:MAG: hypothetical protein A3A73_00340 [Omnitrophica bacterium RIFCSPLOWO2_01_FULL_50_24]|nr:MAG: hypothetical protein A3A73_00340 [Omnitrophica bacterium RIFCSPLOWO2_01_FULL_50_24]